MTCQNVKEQIFTKRLKRNIPILSKKNLVTKQKDMGGKTHEYF